MPSIVRGPRSPVLCTQTLGELIEAQAHRNSSRTGASFPWQHHSLSYQQFADRSKLLAKSMLEAGLQHGDCIGIMAGNCYQYIEVFLGAARIGCPLVVFNNTYSAEELCSALSVSCCKLLFLASNIGLKSLESHIQAVGTRPEELPHLKRIVQLSRKTMNIPSNVEIMPYSAFVSNDHSASINDATLRRAECKVRNTDVLNLQFTSGTTGAPKAAMLTHFNLINNALLFGSGLRLTDKDIVCCPPPLFHCFGLVMGFLGAFTHSSSIVFPCDQFDANLVLDAVSEAKCTVILGVPTMFIAQMEANKRKGYRLDTLRLGVGAGSTVPAPLMRDLRQKMGIETMLIAYGMTETSPVSFMTSIEDDDERRATTVGRIQPHTLAKVVDSEGNILPRGVPGELCVGGYLLQKGYWQNEAKTAEVMKLDDAGIRWVYTGDECVITADEYCVVTGRIKDLIIRGRSPEHYDSLILTRGENISPVQVEDRLLEHKSIADACVVSIKDSKYGEVVGCFLRLEENSSKPSNAEVNQWVRQRLGSHKAPQHVFWIGDPGVGLDYPKTGSGKIQKHILRTVGDKLVAGMQVKPKL
ncbi:long-chain fatty-acid-CoA ligase [Exophiala viscosa]|uniref:long-chain fatty-acid-CoA ligase n=1 Tax=Exophiala viscosa TaxID=2486360 RepID=UPI0021921023|nr:long-chain fatty-acid-CoA ligase [Exophiala viscosa]